MAMFFPALALCALAVSTQDPLRIDVVFHGQPLTPKFEQTAMAEVAEIWARYGVDVRAASSGDAGRSGAIRLDVAVTDRISQRAEIYTLGSIMFVEGEPSTRIVMFPDAIATLVSGEMTVEDHGPRTPPPLFREGLLARVFGRALAHEIGHYLLRSKGHSRTGLMRASPLVYDLVSPERHAFVLSAGEVKQLHALPAWPCAGERSAGGGQLP
jgi:hypothetical protein